MTEHRTKRHTKRHTKSRLASHLGDQRGREAFFPCEVLLSSLWSFVVVVFRGGVELR